MPKISDRLTGLIEHGPGQQTVHLNVLLNTHPDQETVKRIASLSTAEPEILPNSGLVLTEARLENVRAMALVPEITWIDVESEAPLEDLLD